MDKSFNLKVVTPFESKEVDEVNSLLIDTDNGQLEFLPNHADLIVTVSLGDAVVTVNNEKTTYLSGQGFVNFDNKTNTAKIVVNQFTEKSKLQSLNQTEILDKIDELLKNNKSLDSFTIKYLEGQKIGITHEK